MTEPIPDSEFVEPPLFATADDVQFWEPWTANSPLMRPTPAGSFVSRADFDRLRDERDEMIRVSAANIATTQRNMDELRRVAGVLADALRNAPCHCDHPLRAGLPPCSRCSALAVFDTLTARAIAEEATRFECGDSAVWGAFDPAREGALTEEKT